MALHDGTAMPDGVVAVSAPRSVLAVCVARLAFGRLPVTPVVRGSPVACVKTPEAGVPNAGVTNVGEVLRTTEPVPVLVATPVPPWATESGVVRPDKEVISVFAPRVAKVATAVATFKSVPDVGSVTLVVPVTVNSRAPPEVAKRPPRSMMLEPLLKPVPPCAGDKGVVRPLNEVMLEFAPEVASAVLHVNPVPLVQRSPSEDALHGGTDCPLGVVAVKAPSNWLAASAGSCV